MPRRLTQEEFIAKAVAVHGSHYDYSQVVYQGDARKVKIICPAHGDFEQTANSHTQGSGCIKCGLEAMKAKTKMPLADFIVRAREVHGDKYDYSQVDYKSNSKPVKIICLSHGGFSQRPAGHIHSKAGCPKCAIAATTMTTQSFIARAHQVHGDRYDYSQAVYTLNKSKVLITCRVHGPFMQRPDQHLKGNNCPTCGFETMGAGNRITLEHFLAQAHEVHGDKYGYSHVSLGTLLDKVTIICPEHGEFKQMPINHIHGKAGCKKCAVAARAENGLGWDRSSWVAIQNGRPATLYLVRCYIDGEEFYKVGITLLTLKKRFSSCDMPYKYEVVKTYQSQDAAHVYNLEKSILKQFKRLKYKPKIEFLGHTECFSSCEEILEIFPL